MADLFPRVQPIIADRLGVDYDEVTLDAKLKDDLGGDSLDMVEIIMELEDEFGVSIADEAAEKMETVRDVMTYLNANVRD